MSHSLRTFTAALLVSAATFTAALAPSTASAHGFGGFGGHFGGGHFGGGHWGGGHWGGGWGHGYYGAGYYGYAGGCYPVRYVNAYGYLVVGTRCY